ncbi:hypothetical protein [Chryseobacterium sp.]|uniref:hypothetical protein n=1 Tax=Chryseobacterium sp. TaxID=1871047 RepID=UPI00388F53AD
MNLPNSKEVGKFQQLIIKNPLGFVAAIFFLMFGITYFINIRKNDIAEQDWKELYEGEKKKNEDLTYQLLVKAGVLNKQEKEILETNKKIKEETADAAIEILKSKENEK